MPVPLAMPKLGCGICLIDSVDRRRTNVSKRIPGGCHCADYSCGALKFLLDVDNPLRIGSLPTSMVIASSGCE